MFFSRTFLFLSILVLIIVSGIFIYLLFFNEAKALHYYTNQNYQEVVDIFKDLEKDLLNDRDMSYIYGRSLIKLGKFKKASHYLSSYMQMSDYDEQMEYLHKLSIIFNTCNFFIKQKGLLKTIRAYQIEPLLKSTIDDILDFYKISNYVESKNTLFQYNRNIIISFTIRNADNRMELISDLIQFEDPELLGIVLQTIQPEEANYFKDRLLEIYQNPDFSDYGIILPLLSTFVDNYQELLENALIKNRNDPTNLSLLLREMRGMEYSFVEGHIKDHIISDDPRLKSSAIILLRHYIGDNEDAFMLFLAMMLEDKFEIIYYDLIRTIVLNMAPSLYENYLIYWDSMHIDIKEVFTLRAVIEKNMEIERFLRKESGLRWEIWLQLLRDEKDFNELDIMNGLFLISVDTLRRDHLKPHGYPRDTMPGISSLAGMAFDNFYSNSSWTVPSHISMLTGLSPLDHKINSYHDALCNDIYYLPTVLKEKGYINIAFVTHTFVSQNHNFHRDFDFFYFNQEENARSIMDKIENVLKYLSHNHTNEKIFVFIHLYDCHSPYYPPEGFNVFLDERPPFYIEGNDFINEQQNLYNGEIFFVDHILSGFFQLFDSLDSNLIIITSDHGEEFLEHDGVLHGTTLYREVVEIPFIVLADEDRLGRLRPYQGRFLSNMDTPYLIAKALDLEKTWFEVSGDIVELFLFKDNIKKYSFICSASMLKVKHNLHRGTYEVFDLEYDYNELNPLDISEYPHLKKMVEKRMTYYLDHETIQRLEMTEEQMELFRTLGYIN